MPTDVDLAKIRQDITNVRNYWGQRNLKFRDWHEMLILVDKLESKGMETYVSNEPMTFYNMSHYLLTKGDISHATPIENESALELDRRARVHRGCEYMWKLIDRDRQLGGSQTFIDTLSFFMLVLGWYSTVSAFNKETGLLQTEVWNPYDTYPRYANNRLVSCVHSYLITEQEAGLKAENNHWGYIPRGSALGEVVLDDYFKYTREGLFNIILIDGKDVTGWQHRPDMQVLVAPVGGFPDKGSLTRSRSTSSTSGGPRDWRRLAGRGIFEVNETVSEHFNKWKSQISQILRDTSQPVTQEISATPQATPEQLRERNPLFHYAPGEAGIQRVPPPAIPIEVQANLLELRREMQKGSFNDAVFGMVEGQPGFALSLLASSSANQILYPYMDGKHFVLSEYDKFWLSRLKASGKVFQIKGKFIEKLSPQDIPEDVSIQVESKVATPKDWLERGTIANMVDKHLDEATIITEIYGLNDPQAIKRRRSLDRILDSEEAQLVEKISSFYSHADYLDNRGDRRQASLFRRMAQGMEAQIGVPPPGQGMPADMTRIQAARDAGTPEERARVSPAVSPPEATSGFTPTELRRSIGRGTLRGV